ncbi:MAG: CRISPR-associated protein Cas4 [Candidatus Kapaibacteriota bacterium]
MENIIDEFIELQAETAKFPMPIPEFDTDSTPMITPTELIQFVYCPRYIYYLNCLSIPQHEELRFKVLKGREIHHRRQKTNLNYIRKRPECIDKDVSVYLASKALRVRGIVDEVLHLADGTLAPLDYKYTNFTEFTFKTHKIQSTVYAMLIQEVFQKPVRKGFICYVRNGNHLREITYEPKDFEEASTIIKTIFDIISNGYYPRRTRYPNRCVDCCYRNICDKI